MSLIEKLDRVLAVIAAFDAWSCEGDTVRCADGNGCECEMAGKDCPPVYDAMNALLRDHGPAIRQAMIDAERYAWLKEGENDSEVLEFNTHGNAGPDDVWLPRGKGLDDAIDAARARRLAHYAALARATGEGEGHD